MYKKIEKFILDKLKEHKLNPHTFVASDLGYDLKSDFCDSEFNPTSKREECWEEAQDDWYDDFVFAEVVPIVVYLGATIETDDESDAIDAWLERYCSLFDKGSNIYVSNEDQGEPECFMVYGDEFKKVVQVWEPKEYVFGDLFINSEQ